MFEKLERKLVNVLLFFDLFKMKTKIPTDFRGVMHTQDKRVQKLVKRAYEIPFYKKRFDEAGVKPEDIRTGDDLSKLPLLTKDELRAWMNEEAKNPKYDCWFHDTTSGYFRNSADAARFSKGKGLQHGELVPCYDVCRL